MQRRSAGDQVAQVPVQPVHGAASFPGQLVAAVGLQAQDPGVIVSCDAGQVEALGSDQGDAAGVDVVGLAAVAGLEQPGPRGEGGGHVDYVLAGSDEALGEQLTEAVGSLDRPAPLRPLSRPGEQAVDRRAGRSNPDRVEFDQVRGDRCCGVGALVWVDADDYGMGLFLRGAGWWVRRRAT